MIRKTSILIPLLFAFGVYQSAHAQDSIRVLCLYGSIPAKGWKGIEPVFHKGILTRTINLHGGHVGVETLIDSVLSFQPVNYSGLFRSGHIFNHSRHPNSWFRALSDQDMWYVLPHHYDDLDSLRRAVFVIPVTPGQRRMIDSLSRAYRAHTPYDYAFLGMRCASASYEILFHAGLVSGYPRGIWHKIFTTKKFRYALYKEYLRRKAAGWRLYTWKGCTSRQWENDIITLNPDAGAGPGFPANDPKE